jgi:hypothetical protein
MGKATDENACVDSRLRIFGVQGLRVADLSICPLILGSVPNRTLESDTYLRGGLDRIPRVLLTLLGNLQQRS